MSRLKGQLRGRVPVFGPEDRIIELADPARVKRIAQAENAQVIREHKGGRIVRINLRTLSDDSELVRFRGNPRRYSHDHETRDNPPRCWTIRHLGAKDPKVEAFVRDIFRASVLDNLKEAA